MHLLNLTPCFERLPAITLFPDSLELQPNPGPEQLPPEPSWLLVVSVALLALLAILTSAAVWQWLRRPRVARPTPPNEWALAQLRDILCNGEDPRGRYVRAADVLRDYLSARFPLPATKRTTPEFLSLLRACGDLTEAQKKTVVDVLAAADLVKFAGARPDADGERFIDSLRNLIAETSAPGSGRGK